MRKMSHWRAEWRRARWLSPIVRERYRFVLNEFFETGRVRAYRLRAHGATAVLRHNRYDAFVLHEVVRDSFYTPPPQVHDLLSTAGHELRVLDLGGNIGCFGLLLLEAYPASLVAFEPDPSNLAVLWRCIARNGHESKWEVVEACAAPVDGETAFVGGQAALSRVPLPGDPSGDEATMMVPTIDAVPYMREADLLKMDIEGGEWALLDDPRFADAAPPAILLEWHTYDCPDPNPRQAATARLESLGYEVLHEKPAPVADSEPLFGAGALWAWRSANRTSTPD